MLMHLPWAHIPGVRHSLTSVEKVQEGALASLSSLPFSPLQQA